MLCIWISLRKVFKSYMYNFIPDLLNVQSCHYVDMIRINSVMLFPGDKEKQTEYMYLTVPEYTSQSYALMVSKGLDENTSSKYLSTLQSVLINRIGNIHDYSMAISKPRGDYFRQQYSEMFVKGLSAGAVLALCLSKKISKSRAIRMYLENIQNDCCKRAGEYMISGVNVRFTESNIANNIWPRYKDVAHYWAALFRGKVIDDPAQACFVDFSKFNIAERSASGSGLGVFLVLAEKYREHGVAFKPKKSEVPLLDPVSVIRI